MIFRTPRPHRVVSLLSPSVHGMSALFPLSLYPIVVQSSLSYPAHSRHLSRKRRAGVCLRSRDIHQLSFDYLSEPANFLSLHIETNKNVKSTTTTRTDTHNTDSPVATTMSTSSNSGAEDGGKRKRPSKWFTLSLNIATFWRRIGACRSTLAVIFFLLPFDRGSLSALPLNSHTESNLLH